MQYIYTALFTPIEDGSGYYAKVPDLPGCITTGSSLSDAIEQITDAMSAWLVVAEDEGEPIVQINVALTVLKSFRMLYAHYWILPLSVLINLLSSHLLRWLDFL